MSHNTSLEGTGPWFWFALFDSIKIVKEYYRYLPINSYRAFSCYLDRRISGAKYALTNFYILEAKVNVTTVFFLFWRAYQRVSRCRHNPRSFCTQYERWSGHRVERCVFWSLLRGWQLHYWYFKISHPICWAKYFPVIPYSRYMQCSFALSAQELTASLNQDLLSHILFYIP